ncbi:transcription factor [Fusarium albosuccineum]|uniref:Transcription factor n=1 Tax=Fusarium albosuccineum TaxID=1237068 RepID=A0A8H4LDJ6_9HYPO|nr:transcription factor [Fusarium albosuccineum]
MFSTLRQTFGNGDRLLSVEIVPPFDKERTSMRTACERCRIQKSKCVSGENGCMLCVAKNRKCEYSVVTRPRRRTSSVASGGSKSRNDDNNQHKQSNQAGIVKRRSRVQTRQSSPLSTPSSSSQDQVRVAPVSQSSLQDNSIATSGPDTGVEDAEQLFFSGTIFPDSLGQVPAAFPQLDVAAEDFFRSVAGPTPMAAAKLGAGLGGGVGAETSTTRGDSGKHDDNKSVHTSSSANSLFNFSVDQMDFLMDDSRVPTTTMAPSAHDNKVTTEAQPATHFSTPPDLDATSTSTSSSCCCMMTAVSIYEALQVELAWGDPVAGPSPAPSPKSASADSPYSSAGSSWSGSGLGSGTGSGLATCHITPLMTQQTILQRQKAILVRFESLLGCGTCWSRSDFVMLMITMCDRMLTSLEAVERFVCTRTDDSSRVSSNSTSPTDVNALATSRAELDLPPLSRSPHVLQPRVGAWQIDDDDELELVTSLIKSRVTRLGNLIAMAEGTFVQIAAAVEPCRFGHTSGLPSDESADGHGAA